MIDDGRGVLRVEGVGDLVLYLRVVDAVRSW